jgi:TPR repeat protein
MKWYRKASDQGDGDADCNIGGLYHNGRGVTKDDDAAVSWFRKGAAKGSDYAMSDLAACYWTGTGVEKSAREAISWWKQAAEKGNEDARENLKMALEKFDEFGQPRTRK